LGGGGSKNGFSGEEKDSSWKHKTFDKSTCLRPRRVAYFDSESAPSSASASQVHGVHQQS